MFSKVNLLGNYFTIAMIVMLFFGLVVLFWRLVKLRFSYHVDFDSFLNDLKRLIAADDLDRAITLCKNRSSTSLPKIAQRALEAAETDPTTVRGKIEEETLRFLPFLESWHAWLPAMSVLILLTGVWGTLDGLYQSFIAVDVLNTTQKQATIANGIALSLVPTVVGLISSMILLAGHILVRSMALALTENIHYGVSVLHNLLVPNEVATFMPVAAAAGGGDFGGRAGGNDLASEEFKASSDDTSGGDTDDAFDDVSVEDIKDEEEII